MKLYRLILGISLLLLLPSCVKEQQLAHEPGSPIVFGAAASYEDVSPTRTEYSGEMYEVGSGGDVKRYERIDWVKNSDWIRIFCLQAEDGPASDYSVTGDITESDQVSSSAEITPLSHYGLHWGTGTHYFYALYPAAGMKSNYQFKAESASTYSDRTVSASEARIEEVSGDATKAKITGVIPATQEVTLVRGSDLTPAKSYDEYKANMNYAYMYARNKATAGSTGTVELAFKPLVTTYEFTLLNEAGNAVGSKLTQVALRSGSSTMNKLSGTFTATLSETGDPVIASEGTTGNVITVKLPDGGVMLDNAIPLKITILTLPFTQSELTLELTFENNKTRKLALKDSGNWLTVDACKKLYVHNLGVPEYMYYLEPTGPTLTLSDSDRTEAQVVRLVSASAGNTGTAPFRSYRKVVGTAVEEAVTPTVYEYALADANGNPVLVDGHIDWQPWSGHPAALTGLNLTGSTVDKTLSVGIGAYPTGSTTQETKQEDDLHIERMKENAALYGLASYQDLSLYDVSNLHSPRPTGKPTTANCYVVDRAGTYQFPVVYGNAIDWTKSGTSGWYNGANVYAYYDGAKSGSDGNQFDVIHHLQNYATQWISSPYILDDVNLASSAVEAIIVWEDVISSDAFITVENALTDVSSSNLFWAPQKSNWKPATGTWNTSLGSWKTSVPYIRFSVDQNKIRQGNAVIALRKKSGNKEILWSWHIWVTDGYDTDGDAKGDGLEALKLRTTGSNYTMMMPVSIGWCGYNTVKRYKERVWYVRIKQSVGNAVPVTFKVVQAPPVTVTAYKGGDVYYQWGRKDPFLPCDGVCAYNSSGQNVNARNKAAYSPAGFTLVTDNNTSVNRVAFDDVDNSTVNTQYGIGGGSVAHSIRYPYLFFSSTFTYPENYTDARNSVNNWMRGTYPHNLWNMANGNQTGQDLAVAKSVYDPSPPGYSVPRRDAFVGLSQTDRVVLTDATCCSQPYGFTFVTGYDSKRMLFAETGVRDCWGKDSAHDNGRILSVRGDALSWTAASLSRNHCYNLYMDQRTNADGLQTNHANYRAQAFPVRPTLE